MTRAQTLSSLAAALTVLTLAAASPADVMTYHGVGLNQSVGLHAPGRNVNTKAGQMQITYKDVDYDSYCVDIYVYAGSSEVVEKPISVLNNWEQIAYLFENEAPNVSTNLEAASLQVAFWELLYEDGGNPWDAGSGDLYITGNADAVSGANALLAGVPSSYAPTYVNLVLDSPCKQDMLIPTDTPVPEPASMVVLAGGAALVVVRRRRRARA